MRLEPIFSSSYQPNGPIYQISSYQGYQKILIKILIWSSNYHFANDHRWVTMSHLIIQSDCCLQFERNFSVFIFTENFTVLICLCGEIVIFIILENGKSRYSWCPNGRWNHPSLPEVYHGDSSRIGNTTCTTKRFNTHPMVFNFVRNFGIGTTKNYRLD